MPTINSIYPQQAITTEKADALSTSSKYWL